MNDLTNNQKPFLIRKVVNRKGMLSVNLPKAICEKMKIAAYNHVVIQYDDKMNNITFSKLNPEVVVN